MNDPAIDPLQSQSIASVRYSSDTFLLIRIAELEAELAGAKVLLGRSLSRLKELHHGCGPQCKQCVAHEALMNDIDAALKPQEPPP